MTTALDITTTWPVPLAAAAVLQGNTIVSSTGDLDHVFQLASLTKPLAAWATLIAIEEGLIGLGSSAGQPNCTVRHLLAHAGGYGFEGRQPVAVPERNRGYSNTGFEILGDVIENESSIRIADYLGEAVFEPLHMTRTKLTGSPAHGASSTVADMVSFVKEIRVPRLVSTATAAETFRVQYPLLGGIVPGVGRYEQCPWGLGFEIRGAKSPHWTGALNSPSTFGHFGGSGTMFWVDPHADVAVIALTNRDFGDWALKAWPALSDAVIEEFSTSQTGNKPEAVQA